MGYRVAVVGATGNVGREMMQILAEREFPVDEVAAVASSPTQGTEVDYGDCGKPVCCNTHLSAMPPVSMKMAKMQNRLMDKIEKTLSEESE